MFSTKYKQESLFLKKEDILGLATEEEIFKHYLGDFELRKMFNSPLRKDSVPSFNIYYSNSGELVYKDFGGTQGSCIDFVMNLYNLSYKEALFQIYKDLNLNQRKEAKLTSVKKVIQKATVIQVETKKYSKEELEYWASYNIDKALLDKYQVFSVSKVWLNGRLLYVSIPANPIFVYYFIGSDKVKVYRPLDTSGKKWLTNTSTVDLQGYSQLSSKGECLIITKSMKDVMAFKSFGFEAIAPHGEGMYIPEQYITDLKSRFNKIITVYDNDPAGVSASIKLNSIVGSDYWNIPKDYSAKDISDFIKLYGTEEARKLLRTLENKCNLCLDQSQSKL